MPQTRILIVDDEKDYRFMCESHLTEAGYNVQSAHSFALAILLSQNEKFDLFLLDTVFTPYERENVFVLAPELIKFQAAIPAVVFMGFSGLNHAVDALNAGASGFILKPFGGNELIKVIEQALINHGQRLENFYSFQKKQRKLKVFLCHSRKDKDVIRILYDKLIGENFDPWLDEKKIIPGVDWDKEITREVKNSDVVLVCLSKDSVDKRGYIHKEIKLALDVADEQPENTIFIIPVRLDECNIPDRLSKWQWVNYYDKNGFEQIVKSLNHQAKSLEID